MMSKLNPRFLLLLLLVPLTLTAHTPPPGARVFFIGIEDGAVVESPLKIKFGIEGFGITPAGTKGKIRHQAGLQRWHYARHL
ncbi:MAG: hypothetical protein ABW121_22475 [Candidatus Thiodiazotropha sp. 6PLUC7]